MSDQQNPQENMQEQMVNEDLQQEAKSSDVQSAEQIVDEVFADDSEEDFEDETHELEDGELVDGASDSELALECERLRSELKAVSEAASKDKDNMLRIIAEAENQKRRAEADVEREKKFALERFVKAIIPVVDSLDRALELSDRNDPATKSTIDGVEGTYNLLLKELKGFGVECENPVGKPFDPNFHQAISMVASAEVPANHILHVMQKGFILNGRVVRAATVVVAKAPE